MACDGEARQLLDPPGRILQNARGHFLDSAAAVAADVLVVAFAQLIASRTFANFDTFDRSFPLKSGDRPED